MMQVTKIYLGGCSVMRACEFRVLAMMIEVKLLIDQLEASTMSIHHAVTIP